MKSKVFLSILLILIGWNAHSQWTAVNTGITNLNVIPMTVSGTNIFAGTYGGGVFLSTNNGTNWSAVNTGLTDLDIFSMTASGTNVFAGTYGGGVFLSTNNGTSWTAVNNGITNFNTYAMASNGSSIYSGTLGGGVFLSTDNGASWTAVNNGLTNLDVVTLYVNGSDLFAGTAGGGAFLSSNNGASWTAINTGLTNTTVRSFTSSGSNLYAGTAGGGIFVSTNNGASWTASNTGLTNMTVWCMTPVGSDIFAGTAGGGVFLSTNNGASWTAVNTGLPASPDVWSIAVNGTNIYAGMNGGPGVYRRPLSELVTVSTSFNYGSMDYCADASDPTPIITGTPGGVFSSSAGLSIDPVTGEIDLSASTPGVYTVTYTVGGASSDETVTINAMDDASFSYGGADFCLNGANPIPTFIASAGGIFSSGSVQFVNVASGEVDLTNTSSGAQIIAYTTSGVCPNSSTLNVSFTQVDASTALSGFTISANTIAPGATFQWLDCDNNMIPISGETNSSYTATANGNYAVEVSENGCVDTSACVSITTIGLGENFFSESIKVYPNPTNGEFSIEFGTNQEQLLVELYSIEGKLIQTNTFLDADLVQLHIDEASGVYLLEISDGEGNKASIRLVKD